MFNFIIFLKSLKTTWFQWLILRPEAPRSKCFELIMNNTINHFISLGSEYFIKKRIGQQIISWLTFFNHHTVFKEKRIIHILRSPLQYNQNTIQKYILSPFRQQKISKIMHNAV